MDPMKEILDSYQSLSKEWKRKPINLQICGELLTKLKISLTSLSFLPTMEEVSKQELILARDVLEIGAQYSILMKDVEAFERYMAQLKTYYYDYEKMLPDSSYKYELLGLNLLKLLAQNKLGDFHTEMELLPIKILYTNIYIKHPVSIEQYLMEGAYNKVFLAKGNVPADSYTFFMDILLNTIRDEIASCLERAYERIAISEGTRMLYFESSKLMKIYAEKRQWAIENQFFIFKKEEKKNDDIIQSAEMATKAIGYARELEIIV